MAVQAHSDIAVQPRYHFTVEEFEQIVEAGILREDLRLELIHGEIVEMSPIGKRHVDCVAIIDLIVHEQVGRNALVLVQSPILLSGNSQPQPDLAVVRFDRYRTTRASASDTFLVIEVSDSSREHVRRIKLPLYAAAGIPETWIFDLIDNRVERYTDPRADGYRQMVAAGCGVRLASTVNDLIRCRRDSGAC
jgi:Uma2 family endonuclease